MWAAGRGGGPGVGEGPVPGSKTNPPPCLGEQAVSTAVTFTLHPSLVDFVVLVVTRVRESYSRT